MNSSTTPDFWRRFGKLPPDVRERARKSYRIWRDNPHHPGLQFKKVGNYWSVRVDRNWRALGRYRDGILYWFWIGPHDEYERLIGG